MPDGNNDNGNHNMNNNHYSNSNNINTNNNSNDDHNVCAGLLTMRHYRACLVSSEQSVIAVYRCVLLCRIFQLFSIQKCIFLIQRYYHYTGNVTSEASGDSKNVFLHCGDVAVVVTALSLLHVAGNKPSATDVTKDAEEEGWAFFSGISGMSHVPCT